MMLVRHIENGTVVDHISAGQAPTVLKMIEEKDSEDTVAMLMNVPSSTHGRKDVLKLENVRLDEDVLDLISLVAPEATINLIEDSEVVKKRKVKLPDKIEGVISCFNPKCITNQEREPVEPEFEVLKDPVRLKCDYCGEVFSQKNISGRIRNH